MQRNKIIELIDGLLSKQKCLSFTSFEYFRKSPAHFIEYKFRDKQPDEFLNLGSLAHAIIENDKLNDKYVLFRKSDLPEPSSTMNNKLNREYKQKLVNECLLEGKTLVKEDDLETAKYIRDALMANTETRGLIEYCTESERKIEYEFEDLKWLGYQDKWCEDFTIDFKTTTDASQNSFKRFVRSNGSYRQALGYNISDNDMYKPFFFIAVETKPPFGISVHSVPKFELDKAYDSQMYYLQQFKRCLVDEKLFEQSYGFWAKEGGIFETYISI